jgi:hypothetical protein
MIVKVQVSLATTHEKRQVLVYNEDKSVYYEDDASREILQRMDGRVKVYFNARMVGTDIEIQGEVKEEQDW